MFSCMNNPSTSSPLSSPTLENRRRIQNSNNPPFPSSRRATIGSNDQSRIFLGHQATPTNALLAKRRQQLLLSKNNSIDVNRVPHLHHACSLPASLFRKARSMSLANGCGAFVGVNRRLNGSKSAPIISSLAGINGIMQYIAVLEGVPL